ncbi:hypothetical protein OPV22_006841 [Ensete ventricosum]|uniref:Uncharacterized protein n=1 Tax=Ensete ventricosum TaxID=4639 RepID=A0AAV8RS06_ENSVE|nr:hypothetical protein OPV22_006841 [Ensete ventricosum]
MMPLVQRTKEIGTRANVYYLSGTHILKLRKEGTLRGLYGKGQALDMIPSMPINFWIFHIYIYVSTVSRRNTSHLRTPVARDSLEFAEIAAVRLGRIWGFLCFST